MVNKAGAATVVVIRRDMDTKTLDAKLRERGREKLERAIDEMMPELNSLSAKRMAQWIETPLSDVRPGKPSGLLAAWEVLDIVKETIIKSVSPEWEQAEVDKFITDVGNLKGQAEELEQRVNQ